MLFLEHSGLLFDAILSVGNDMFCYLPQKNAIHINLQFGL